MAEDRTCITNRRDTELNGVVYRVTSHYSASGSLEEILKKVAMEAIRVSGNLS